MRIARKSVIVVDIHPDFERTLAAKPLQGQSFLSGEPYVRDYLTNMDTDCALLISASTPLHTYAAALRASKQSFRVPRQGLNTHPYAAFPMQSSRQLCP